MNPRDKLNSQELFESLVYYAAQRRADALAEQLTDAREAAEPHVFSSKFERNMKRLLRRQRRTPGRVKTVLQTIACVIVALVICGTVAWNVEAIRVPIIRHLTSVTETYTAISPDKPDYQGETSLYSSYLPSYIPDGYELEQTSDKGGFLSIVYSNQDDQKIVLVITHNMGNSRFDTEDASNRALSINGHQAWLSEKDENRVILVVLANDKYLSITSELAADTSIKIMESIKFMQN